MAAGQKIRIRLKAYDHEVIDQSAKKLLKRFGELKQIFEDRYLYLQKSIVTQ
jgi:ribosomal protein S10